MKVISKERWKMKEESIQSIFKMKEEVSPQTSIFCKFKKRKDTSKTHRTWGYFYRGLSAV